MVKLRLELEAITVESFATLEGAWRTLGTVNGHGGGAAGDEETDASNCATCDSCQGPTCPQCPPPGCADQTAA